MIAPADVPRPRTVEEAARLVGDGRRWLPVGAGTKPTPSSPPAGYTAMSLTALRGILEYDPGEYTFTARAGTPVAEISAELARHGQYLPFDPLLGEAGSTLGGAIAAGLSGPGRLRYGGVRDFILGVQFITGAGEIVRGGGKVVKNAAGFDFPKLLVGSLGRLGVIVEATFKVFPRPPAAGTLRVDLPDFAAACAILTRLAAAPFDLEGLELEPPSRIWLRLSGEAETLANRLAGLARLVGGRSERLDDESDSRFWRTPPWPALVLGALVVKVPTTPSVLPEFERMLEGLGAGRRYSAAGNVAWIVRDGGTDELDRALRARGLTGLVLQGAAPPPLIGAVRGEEFRRRIKAALDPNGIFPDF